MSAQLVTVFGGTGYLGRHVVARLAADGVRVRVAVRRPEAAAGLWDGQPVEAVPCDLRDVESVAAALDGAGGAVNAVGLYHERGSETFAAVHVEGARRVAERAAAAGTLALVQVSGIGADPSSASKYVRARAAGEVAVRDAFPAATILRPSVLFGPGDSFFNTLAAMARTLPVVPLFGHGDTRLQPVFVEDVAAAVAKALADPAARARVFELGGPRSYTYRSLLVLLLDQLELTRTLMPVPFVVWEAQAGLLSALPRPPLTHDQITLMKKDNVVGLGMPGLAALGIEAHSVEAVLPTYLG
ncbi:MAG: NAD-dependent epimerase/dehydratase family protein [Kiloniellales bacterium]